MSLIKLATNFKQFIRPLQRNKGFVGTSAITGAAIGGGMGYGTSYETDKYGYSTGKKKPGASTLSRTLVGAAVGGVALGGLAGNLSGTIDKAKLNFKKFNRQYGKSSSPFKGRSTDHAAFFKEHGYNHREFKTKKEVDAVRSKLAKKYHPDMNPGIDPKKMSKVNNDFDNVKKTGWYEKLAMIIRGEKWV